MKIKDIIARQILDSRGHPTIEATVHLDTGDMGTAAVPSGASTGSHEAVELRDGGETYNGRGVIQAVQHITGPIKKALKGIDVRDQVAVDRTMIDLDGTVNKASLGANAILAVSMAATRAHAALVRQPLWKTIRALSDLTVADDHRPGIMMNILNGGKHADNGLNVQEYLVLPKGKTASQMIERGVSVYSALWSVLRDRHLTTLLGDEGGFAPTLADDEAALKLIMEAITKAGLVPGQDVNLGLDFAASSFFDAGKIRYMFGPAHGLSGAGMIGVVNEWRQKYPIISVEDPLAEDDWESWSALTETMRSDISIVGDDLFVTSVERLERGIAARAANAILIKPNQVGTITETLAAIRRARSAGYQVVASHRSGETTDAFITDLAVGVGADYLKAGAPARGERVAKYNRYLEIEEAA